MKEIFPKRVLHIVSAMDRGGAETLIMNVYRKIDRRKLQFDFVVHRSEKGSYDNEILEMGGKIFRIQSLGSLGPIQYTRELKKVMGTYPYIAVHSHTDYQSGFPALAAKQVGIPIRICHSHSSSWLKGVNIKDKAQFKMLQQVIKYSATSYCSCSKEAAQFLFGKQGVKHTHVLRNGIDVHSFIHAEENSRSGILKELQLSEDTITIGHVGKFSPSKNHIFLLHILEKLVHEDKRYTLLLVGDGPLQQQIKNEAEILGILEHIKFLGVREDIARLMKAFDVFLFPSLFEGFGIVTIEAQSAGTPCILSDTIPKSTDMGLGLTKYLNLNDDIAIWCDEIKKVLLIERPNSSKIIEQISKQGYNIQENLNEWLDLYGVQVG